MDLFTLIRIIAGGIMGGVATLALIAAYAALAKIKLLEGRISNHDDVLRVLAKRTEPARRAPTGEPF
jgi:hypothetical protein